MKNILYIIALLGLCVPIIQAEAVSHEGVLLEVFDYSSNWNRLFFETLGKEASLAMPYVNAVAYPILVKVQNKSEKTYVLAPDHISAPLRVDYAKLLFPVRSVKQLLGLITFTVSAIVGDIMVCSAGCTHPNPDYKIPLMVGLSSCTIAGLSLWYIIAKEKSINEKRLASIKENALPQEGMKIKPGQSVEVVLFLTREGHSQDSFEIVLRESKYPENGCVSFNVSFGDCLIR